MPIDSWDPVFSSARDRRTVKPAESKYELASKRFLVALKDSLLACGWTLDQELFATGSIPLDRGAPTVTPPSGSVTTTPAPCWSWWNFMTLAGLQYKGYDPYRETQGACAGVIWFEWGTTEYATVNNLAGAITGNSPYNASVRSIGGGHYAIDLVAQNGG